MEAPRQRSPLAAESPSHMLRRRLSPQASSPVQRATNVDDDPEEAKDVLGGSPKVVRKSPQRQASLLQLHTPRKKWTSAFRVVQSITRFKNGPTLRSRKSSLASNVSFFCV